MGCVDRACVPRAAGGLPRQEYVLHTIIFLLHGAFVGVVIANAGQLVHGAGFGVLRWPSLPSFMVVGAVALLLVRVAPLCDVDRSSRDQAERQCGSFAG
jgi:hypothetical protein